MGIGIHSPNIANFPVSSTTIATSNTLNIFSGELLAIDVALAQLIHLSGTKLSQTYKSIAIFRQPSRLERLEFSYLA